MARPKKNEQLEPTKNTQEEIEAALARACGQNPTSSQPIPQLQQLLLLKNRQKHLHHLKPPL